MSVSNAEPTLSPSLFHRHLMDTVQPSMSYDGGDVMEWQACLRPKVRELVGFPDGDRIDLNPKIPVETRPRIRNNRKTHHQQRTWIRHPRLPLLAGKRDVSLSLLHLRSGTHHGDAPFDSGRTRRQQHPNANRG